MMEIKVNTIITLDTEESYVILNEMTYDNDIYYLVMGVDEKKEIVESNVAIFKKVEQNNEVFIEKITDSKKIIELTNLFKSQL